MLEMSEEAFIVYTRAFYIAQKIAASDGEFSQEFSRLLETYASPFDNFQCNSKVCDRFANESADRLLSQYNVIGGRSI